MLGSVEVSYAKNLSGSAQTSDLACPRSSCTDRPPRRDADRWR